MHKMLDDGTLKDAHLIITNPDNEYVSDDDNDKVPLQVNGKGIFLEWRELDEESGKHNNLFPICFIMQYLKCPSANSQTSLTQMRRSLLCTVMQSTKISKMAKEEFY